MSSGGPTGAATNSGGSSTPGATTNPGGSTTPGAVANPDGATTADALPKSCCEWLKFAENRWKIIGVLIGVVGGLLAAVLTQTLEKNQAPKQVGSRCKELSDCESKFCTKSSTCGCRDSTHCDFGSPEVNFCDTLTHKCVESPTAFPSAAPSFPPSVKPSLVPTPFPSAASSFPPSAKPSPVPTEKPSPIPIKKPSPVPTDKPSDNHSECYPLEIFFEYNDKPEGTSLMVNYFGEEGLGPTELAFEHVASEGDDAFSETICLPVGHYEFRVLDQSGAEICCDYPLVDVGLASDGQQFEGPIFCLPYPC